MERLLKKYIEKLEIWKKFIKKFKSKFEESCLNKSKLMIEIESKNEKHERKYFFPKCII